MEQRVRENNTMEGIAIHQKSTAFLVENHNTLYLKVVGITTGYLLQRVCGRLSPGQGFKKKEAVCLFWNRPRLSQSVNAWTTWVARHHMKPPPNDATALDPME